MPYAYTEQGIGQLSTVVHSKIAIEKELYTRKALEEMAKIDLRHLIAVEEGRSMATDSDIEAISRVFHVKPEDWIK